MFGVTIIHWKIHKLIRRTNVHNELDIGRLSLSEKDS